MRKNIAILGSTGSIGTTTLKIILKKKNLFNVHTLVANSNYLEISKQILKFKPTNFIINDHKTFEKIQKKFRNKKVNIYNNFINIKSKNKLDLTVVAIPGIEGLEPTIHYTKISKKILLANKESIICGWNLISKNAKKYKTKIIPLDSEHFSINELIKTHKVNEIKKIYLTASGGPFLKTPNKKLKFVKPLQALKHPKWNMGKKISIDSATLMNKILELIEARKIFNIDYKKFDIIIHPQSLVHAIIELHNGTLKLLYHLPDMTIPIVNALFDSKLNIDDFLNTRNVKIENLQFLKPSSKKFPSLKIIPKLNKYVSTPIIVNAANEILVDQFLKQKISYNSIMIYLLRVLKDKNYKKYAIQNPVNLQKIYMIDKWSRNITKKLIN